MPRALEGSKDGWDELGQDLAGAPTKIRQHIRVFQVVGLESMNVYVPKNKATSRHLGQCRDVAKRLAFPRCDVDSHIATFLRGIFFNVATFGPTSRRCRETFFSTSRR